MNVIKYKMKWLGIYLISFCFLIVWGVTGVEAISGEFAVIVNESNNYSAGSRDMVETVRQLYLKKRSDWPNKIDAKAFARPADSSEQKAFMASVLGLSQAGLDEHWISVKSQTGQSAPRAIGSDDIVIKFVNKYSGAFAVLKADKASSGSGTKVLFTFP